MSVEGGLSDNFGVICYLSFFFCLSGGGGFPRRNEKIYFQVKVDRSLTCRLLANTAKGAFASRCKCQDPG